MDNYIKQDPKFMRPAEVDCLRGDSSKALEVLEWSPSVDFKELVRRMVWSDINEID